MLSLLCLQSTLTCFSFFFFNDTATTEIYTLSLHDALPIYEPGAVARILVGWGAYALSGLIVSELNQKRRLVTRHLEEREKQIDRKSTRLNSSHGYISYAVFCLKKKKKNNHDPLT